MENMHKMFKSIYEWLTNKNSPVDIEKVANKVEGMRSAPFLLFQLSFILVYFVGFSWVALIAALFFCYIRIFAIGAFYHRYFSHRAYKTNRFWQAIFAIWGACSMQRGPLWWASHHRDHHRWTDTEKDPHSPVISGFWWSHIGWVLSSKNFYYDTKNISDLMKFPELVFIDRMHLFIVTVFAALIYYFGVLLNYLAPSLGTSGWQMLVWGFFISTIFLFHITVSINSFAHIVGSRTYDTKDHSKNNFLLALLTFGEGWHNNHHHYSGSARQGFTPWQIDITYYTLLFMQKIGIIHGVKGVPKEIIESNKI